MKFVFVMVVYTDDKSWRWPKVSVPSFRSHFPDDPFLVVDHNHNILEQKFLHSWGASILEHDGPRTHGGGMDAALLWCLKHGYDVMVHFEPDCLITSRDWCENMLEAINEGYEMAGSHQVYYGPIHPCPSTWVCDAVRGTFQRVRNYDYDHPMYNDLIKSSNYNRKKLDADIEDWDTGLKNWFESAVRGKAALVNGDGIYHYWLSRCRGPEFFNELHGLCNLPRLPLLL